MYVFLSVMSRFVLFGLVSLFFLFGVVLSLSMCMPSILSLHESPSLARC